MKEKIRVFIRTDASLEIGSGHVMRCLTLAEALRNDGAEVQFVCREHCGNLIELIRQCGFIVHDLIVQVNFDQKYSHENKIKNEYQNWLGASQEKDALDTINAFQNSKPEWLIVDHYSMGIAWESQLRPYVRKIMAIDDLANRPHQCDLLLDQNYIINGESRYDNIVPKTCLKMLGAGFALLRPEFLEVRKKLKSRTGNIQRVLVFFGGTDSENLTGKALEVLSFQEFRHLDVDVVIGSQNPHRNKIEKRVDLRQRTKLYVQVNNMAELMNRADLALGAGGSTTWERLCIGLPSLVVTVEKNQIPFTKSLHQEGYLSWLGDKDSISLQKIQIELKKSLKNKDANKLQSQKGLEIVKGNGVSHVVDLMYKMSCHAKQ